MNSIATISNRNQKLMKTKKQQKNCNSELDVSGDSLTLLIGRDYRRGELLNVDIELNSSLPEQFRCRRTNSSMSKLWFEQSEATEQARRNIDR